MGIFFIKNKLQKIHKNGVGGVVKQHALSKPKPSLPCLKTFLLNEEKTLPEKTTPLSQIFQPPPPLKRDVICERSLFKTEI